MKCPAQFVTFTAQTRMSGVDLDGVQYRKGATDAIRGFVTAPISNATENTIERISRSGGTPLVVATRDKVFGVIHLKDVVKGGIKERFAQLRKMGIRTIMITGDNKLTATAIAAEAGRGRFSRRSETGGQTRADPKGTKRGAHGGHDWRRHQ
jgi:K+-transporting ATPase ATPase B chain